MSPQPAAIPSQKGGLGEPKPELTMHQLLRDSKSGPKSLEHSFQGKKEVCCPQTSLAATPGTHLWPVTLQPLYRRGYHWDSTATWSSVELAPPWLGHMVVVASPLSGSKEHDWPQERDSWAPRVNQAPWTLTWLITSLHSGTATGVGTGSPLRS